MAPGPRTSASVAAIAFSVLAAVAARPADPSVGQDDPLRLGIAGAANSNVSLAAAGDRVVVTWAAKSGSATDVFAAFSQDGGASFDSPTRVNDIVGDARVSGEQAPRVVMGEGTAVVWVSRKEGGSVVRLAKARAGQQAFAPATTVHADGLAGPRGWPSLAVDGQGDLHAAWLDTREGQTNRRSDESGASVHQPMRQDLFQAAWRANGTHDEVKVASNVCFCCKTAVAAALDGSIYVAWRHVYPPNLRDIAVAHSTDGGRTFGPPVRVSDDHWALDGCPEDGPAMAVDAQGAIHIAWPTMVGERAKGIFYSYSTDGARTFAPRARVDDGDGSAAHPQLALANRTVAVAWDQGRTARRVFLREIGTDPKASAWTPRLGSLQTVSPGDLPAVYPAVAFAPSAIVVAWTQETSHGSEIRLRRVRP